MAGNIPVGGDMLQVRVGCSTVDQAGLNVLHYVVGGVSGGGVTLADIAAGFQSVLAPLYKTFLAVPASFRGVGVTNLTGLRTLESIANSLAGPGSAGINLAASQLAGLISFKSAFAGPANRGRMYVPFPSQTSTDVNGLFTAGTQTVLGNIGAAVAANRIVTVAGASTTMFLVIKHGNPLPPNYATVLQYLSHARVATQRRRGGYGRLNVAPF